MDEITFDLEAIMDFVFQNKTKDKSSEIREIWEKKEGESLEMVQKSLAEVKSDNLGAVANIRYDLVKLLIQEVASIDMANNVEEVNESLDIDEETSYTGFPMMSTFGQMVALNTLQKEGMMTNLDSKILNNE